MDETSTGTAVIGAFAKRNEILRKSYKTELRVLGSQAAARMIQSMLDQMRLHASLLVSLGAPPPGSNDFPGIEEPEEPADATATSDCDILERIRIRETRFADDLRSASTREDLPESIRHELVTMAANRHKFASWAKDHLELLSLFGA